MCRLNSLKRERKNEKMCIGDRVERDPKGKRKKAENEHLKKSLSTP